MKTIIFKYNKGRNDILEDEYEFDDDVTEEEITQEYIQWMIQQISDYCTWYEK